MVPAETITVHCKASALTDTQAQRLRDIAENRRAFTVLDLGIGGARARALLTGWQLDGDDVTLYAAIGRPRLVPSGDHHLPVGVRLPGLSTIFTFETRDDAMRWLAENAD
jgi:hypothetical protein